LIDPKLESIIDKGRELQAMGQHELAQIYYDQSLEYYKDKPIYSLYINIEKAWSIEGRGYYDEAQDEFLQLLQQAIVISDSGEEDENLDARRALIQIYHGLSQVERRLENIESSFVWSQKALVEASAINDHVLIAVSKYYLARSHYYSGKLERVFQLLNESIPVLKGSDNKHLYGRVLILLANSYQMAGEFELSLQYYDESYKIFEALHDITQIPIVLNNMSVIYKFRGEYTISLRLLRKIEWMNIDWLLLYHVLDNIAEILLFTGDIGEARKTAQELVHLAREHHLQALIGRAVGLLAFIEQYNDLPTARALFEESIELLTNSEVELELFDVLSRYCRFLIKTGDYEIVEDLLDRYQKILDQKSITIYNADFKLTRGLLEREKNINLGLARELYLQGLRLARETQLNFSRIKAYIYLAEIELEIYQLKGNPMNISQAGYYILKGHELATNSKQYPDIASINLVRALLSQFNGNLNEAIEIINDTLQFVKEKGLKLQEAQAIALKRKLQEQKSLFFRDNEYLEQKSEIKSVVIEDKIKAPHFSNFDSTSALLNTIRIFFHDDFSKFTPSENEISIAVFFLSNLGPIAKIEDLSEHLRIFESQSKTSIDEILMLMGTSFSLAVGQGNHYQTGLFGPLPAPRLPGKNAIVFSSKVKDFDNDLKGDKRFEPNTNFGYACLIYPKEFDTVFFERERLEFEFQQLLDNIEQISKDKKKLKQWKSNLLNVIAQQFMPQVN
jgi:tetratricopeptide (TPR) repeat protein